MNVRSTAAKPRSCLTASRPASSLEAMSLLNWTSEPPVLRAGYLLVALEGFVDAGGAGSSAVRFLRHRWESDVVATFDREALIDYRARRPTVVVDSGRLRRLEWPEIELCAATLGGPHDVAFLLGPEPDMRWSTFAADVVDACRRLGVEAVIGLGAYPAAVPHTRPTPVVKAGNAAGLALVPGARDVSGYTGPVGAGTMLQAAFNEAGLPAVGLWAEVPHYLAGSPHPAGALALVRLVVDSLGAEVDTAELESAARLHRQHVDSAVAAQPEAAQIVGALEQHVDGGGRPEDLPSGEDLAEEIERFLRAEGGRADEDG